MGKGRPRTHQPHALTVGTLKKRQPSVSLSQALKQQAVETRRANLRRSGRRSLLVSPLNCLLSRFDGGRVGAMAILRLSSDDETKRVVQEWDRIPPSEQARMKMEVFVERLGLTPGDLVGMIHKTAYDTHVDAGHAMAAQAYPKIMEASIKRAAKVDKGTDERRMHFQATGFVPSVHGTSINVGIKNVQGGAKDDEPVSPGRLPSFRQVSRTVVRELPAHKGD